MNRASAFVHIALSSNVRALAVVALAAPLLAGNQPATFRVSVATGNVQSNSFSSDIARNRPSISGDGRFVAFESQASNLVAGDTNGTSDIFVHDRQTGVTTRVSLSSSGAQPTAECVAPEITSDGRFVLFTSSAPNLVAGDTNFATDVFRRDLQTGTTVRVSIDAAGAQVGGASTAPSITPDGRYVAFESSATTLVPGDTNNTMDVFVKDLLTGAVVRASTSSSGAQGNFIAFDASISSDGLVVAFQSAATNLVAGDTNGVNDLFVKRLDTGAIVRASVRPGGAQSTVPSDGPMLSRDGRFLAFWSDDPMLVLGDFNGVIDVFVRDLALGQTTRANLTAAGAAADARCWFPDLSSNGLAVAFAGPATNLVAGDTNNKDDVFVRDLQLAGPAVFCTAKVNSAGCTPAITFSGTPTVGAGSFTIGATQVLNNKSGVLFYGYGSTAIPFYGGTRCATLPLRRTPLQNSLGNPPPNDCSGAYSFDMHAWIVSGADPSLTVGARVVAQYWSRDAASTQGAGLTDAMAFSVCP